jgi:hypothetical protein
MGLLDDCQFLGQWRGCYEYAGWYVLLSLLLLLRLVEQQQLDLATHTSQVQLLSLAGSL